MTIKWLSVELVTLQNPLTDMVINKENMITNWVYKEYEFIGYRLLTPYTAKLDSSQHIEILYTILSLGGDLCARLHCQSHNFVS